MNKIKLSLLIPIVAYIVFISTLYFNTTIASLAFFIMFLSTIIITIFTFNDKGVKNVKEA